MNKEHLWLCRMSNVRVLYLGVFFCVLFFSHSISAMAATLYANSATGNDTTGDGTSGNPYATFHKAYTVAASSGDTLNLTGTFDWSSAGETGDASTSGYTLAKSMTIVGQSAATTFIQASSTESTADRRVFTVNSGKSVTLKNVTVRYGVTTATESAGGIKNSGSLTIQNATISHNLFNSTTNYYGAGAIDLPNDANATLTISTSTISHNSYNGKYYGSGAIYAGQSNTITITSSTIHDNHATSTNPTTFAYSYAEPSGAIGVFRFVTTTITNSTITNNTTNSYGGALQVYYPNSYKITNTTIANNTAAAGAGGILFESVTNGYNIHIKNTILANNIGNGVANDIYVVSGSDVRITDNGYNIVETSTNKTWSGTGDITGDQVSLNLASALSDNSATNGVQTLALSSGSVAIDAGDSATHSSILIPSYDQRGGTRSGTTDIGAFEYGAGGIADVTSPSVSLTAPSASATVAGVVSLTASASDNVGVAGVKFYVDGVLQGAEDTASPFALSWNSVATTTGSHSAFAVARDAANNYATSSSVSFIVDNTKPVLSSIATTTATTTTTITWTSDEISSSLINFGLTSSYGTSTPETNTAPRVTSHSVLLSGLTACTRYHYRVQSKDAVLNTATSSDATFLTSGCSGSAQVVSTTVGSIATTTGGTLTKGTLTLTVPIAFTATTSTVVFQAHTLSSAEFFASASGPSGKSRAGDTAITLKALIDATTTLTSFSSPLTVTMTYTSSDVVGIDETTLLIYRYDGTSWYALSSCSVNTTVKTVTCSTTAFSDFALFGDASAVSSSATLVANGPLYQGTGEELPGYVAPRMQTIYPDGTVVFTEAKAVVKNTQEAIATTTQVQSVAVVPLSVVFTRTLRAHFEGEDVRELQKFLNSQGFVLSNSGIGSHGFETEYFGPLTYNALVKFQEAHSSRILTPLFLTKGTGIFAEKTREVANELYSSSR